MTDTKPGMPSFTEEQIRGWIKEEEDVIRAWIVDEMKRFFGFIKKAQMDQLIKVVEAYGFTVVDEDAPEPVSQDNAELAQDTTDQSKVNSYIEADYFTPPYW